MKVLVRLFLILGRIPKVGLGLHAWKSNFIPKMRHSAWQHGLQIEAIEMEAKILCVGRSHFKNQASLPNVELTRPFYDESL